MSDMMTIHIDTREQQPYDFLNVNPVLEFTTTKTGLPTGDYMVDTSTRKSVTKNMAIVERKSLADLYSTIAQGRDRFMRELERMSKYGYRAVVIEASWFDILTPNRTLTHKTRMLPKSVMASLLAWSQRFGVHLFPVENRDVAEVFTYRILERWFRDKKSETRLETQG